MNVSWDSLRCLNGSQALAFEELCCQLLQTDPPVPDARFVRKGTRDAGVEGFWELPDGSEHGLQAKFFRQPPNSGQWGQIDESVKTALKKHPKLTKYTICVPADRDNPRIEDQKDYMKCWDERVEKWEGWAQDRQRSVEFEFCGQSELLRLLTDEKNVGLKRFWFGKDELSDAWFSRRKDESIAPLLNNRYLPALHVDITDLDACIEGLLHEDIFGSSGWSGRLSDELISGFV